MSKRVRTLIAAGAAACAMAAYAAPSASAAPATITGTALNTFDAAAYRHDAGTLAQLLIGGGTHNVTATVDGPDDEPLFSSPTISAGATGVNGTQYAEPGSYPFICTIHPGTMGATLNVAGTPLPRPSIKLKIKNKKLKQVVRKREVKVKAKITGGQGEAAEVNVRLGKKPIGIATATTSTGVLKIELTSKGHRRLENRRKAKLKAEASIDFGAPTRTKRLLK